MSTVLSHVVPALWPQQSAIGDYALELAIQLRRRHGIESRFIVCDPDRDGPSRAEGFVIRRLRVKSEAGIWSLLGSPKESHTRVILHYSAFGYQRRGIPLWLYCGIRSWLAESLGIGRSQNFHVVFHDSHPSTGSVLQRDYFFRKGQQWLARAFHRLSNLSVVCSRQTQVMLDATNSSRTIWLPRPSILPLSKKPRCERTRSRLLRFAITGPLNSRVATIRAHGNLLRAFDQKRLLSAVVLVGGSRDNSDPVTDDVDLLQRRVPANRIELVAVSDPQAHSNALATADLLLLPDLIAEAHNTNSFMAALSSGCPPVLPSSKQTAPLTENEHFVVSDDSRPCLERLQRMATGGHLDRIAEAGRQWYGRHADWSVIARKYLGALFDSETQAAVVQNMIADAPITASQTFQQRPCFHPASKAPYDQNLPAFGQAG
jgi:hypothetical protein